MRHGHPQLSQTRPPGGLALLRLVAALAVMLLAVLPHATLAASALHGAPPAVSSAVAASHAHHAGHRTQAPCQDDGEQAGEASPSMPSCCSLGCGLLASAPAITLGAVATDWRQLSPGQPAVMVETAPEPAERPPRRAR